LAAICLAGLVLAVRHGQATEVDLQLVLAADVSGSMSRSELILQRGGYANAFQQPDVVEAILSGALGRIAVTYVEWAGRNDQVIVVPWTILSNVADIDGFSRHLASAPIAPGDAGAKTALSSGLLFCATLLRLSGLHSIRQTIDVSGDGMSNDGPALAQVRQQVLDYGIVINGLSMTRRSGQAYALTAMPDPAIDDIHAYYREQVIGGPGAFALPVDDLADFPAAIRRKLVIEIASR
jgi:hypothetical protein